MRDHGRTCAKIAVVCPVPPLTKATGFIDKLSIMVKEASARGCVMLFAHDVPTAVMEMCWRVVDFRKRKMPTSVAFVTTALSLVVRDYDCVITQTMFHPLFPVIILGAKLGRARIIYRETDPVVDTVKLMPREVRRRSRCRPVAAVVPWLAGIADWLVLRSADCVIATSKGLAEEVRRKTQRCRVKVVYNYVRTDPAEVAALDPHLIRLVVEGKTLFMYFGYVQPEIRGIEMLLQTVRGADSSAHLVLMGEVQDAPYFHQLVADLGVAERVSFLSPRPRAEALAHLASAHFCILGPHHPKVLPAKLFDAVAVRVPLVLPGNMGEAVEMFGGCSYVYDPDSVESLRRVLDQACCDLRNGHLRERKWPTLDEHTFEYGFRRVLADILPPASAEQQREEINAC